MEYSISNEGEDPGLRIIRSHVMRWKWNRVVEDSDVGLGRAGHACPISGHMINEILVSKLLVKWTMLAHIATFSPHKLLLSWFLQMYPGITIPNLKIIFKKMSFWYRIYTKLDSFNLDYYNSLVSKSLFLYVIQSWLPRGK